MYFQHVHFTISCRCKDFPNSAVYSGALLSVVPSSERSLFLSSSFERTRNALNRRFTISNMNLHFQRARIAVFAFHCVGRAIPRLLSHKLHRKKKPVHWIAFHQCASMHLTELIGFFRYKMLLARSIHPKYENGNRESHSFRLFSLFLFSIPSFLFLVFARSFFFLIPFFM